MIEELVQYSDGIDFYADRLFLLNELRQQIHVVIAQQNGGIVKLRDNGNDAQKRKIQDVLVWAGEEPEQGLDILDVLNRRDELLLVEQVGKDFQRENYDLVIGRMDVVDEQILKAEVGNVAIQILLLDNHVENNESIDFDVVREKIYADVKELFQVGFRLQCIAHLVAPPDVIFA